MANDESVRKVSVTLIPGSMFLQTLSPRTSSRNEQRLHSWDKNIADVWYSFSGGNQVVIPWEELDASWFGK